MKMILVVDDEFGFAEAVAAVLEDEGYRVVTAANGQQALTRLTEGLPHLIILDYQMPVMDGRATLEALAADQRYVGIPVLMMSGVPEETVRQGLRIAAFLRKPFDVEALVGTVQRVIGSS